MNPIEQIRIEQQRKDQAYEVAFAARIARFEAERRAEEARWLQPPPVCEPPSWPRRILNFIGRLIVGIIVLIGALLYMSVVSGLAGAMRLTR